MDEEDEEPRNPFIFGVVVDQPFYCSRKPLEDQIRNRLLSGQNIYLMGRRRVGKTSLVENLGATHFKKRFIRVDFMTVKSSEEAVEWILNAWLNYEKANRRIQSAIEFISSLNIDVAILGNRVKVAPGGEAVRRVSFDELFQQLDQKPKKNEAPIILFFDEFQSLLNLEESDRYEFLGRLRKGIQHLKHVRVIYAGSVRSALHEIFQHNDSPFYNSAEPMEVGPIEPIEKFYRFLDKKFAAGGRTILKGFWEEVETIITDHNPSDLQRLCAAVWETTHRNCEVSKDSIDDALERIFEHESRMNYSIIEQSTGLQKRCLLGIANHGGKSPTSTEFLEKIRHRNGSSVLKAISFYVKLSVLIKTDDGYIFTNPFFREWLVRKDL